MRCSVAERLMSLQLDGALAPAEAARLSEHRQRCDRCRVQWAAMQKAHDCLGGMQTREPAPGFTNRVLARLPQERRALVPQSPIWARASLVVMTAMIVLLVGIGGALLLAAGAVPSDWAATGQGGQAALSAAWEAARGILVALGHVLQALWLALRWPWAPVVLGVGAVAALVVGWLYHHGRRRIMLR